MAKEFVLKLDEEQQKQMEIKCSCTIEEMCDDYDWKEAFAYAEKGMDQVKKVIASDCGANDEEDWVALFQMKDQTFMTLEAGCDYTGWD